MGSIHQKPKKEKKTASSLLSEEKIWQEGCHLLIKLILRWQEHRLVIDQQKQRVEEEEQNNASDHDNVCGDAVLLCCDTILAVQWFEQIAQACSDTITFRDRSALSVWCKRCGFRLG